MKCDLKNPKVGAPRIILDLEAAKALHALLGDAIAAGHGFQAEDAAGAIPEIVLVDEADRILLPARPSKVMPKTPGAPLHAAQIPPKPSKAE
jgi:hypothetical protein